MCCTVLHQETLTKTIENNSVEKVNNNKEGFNIPKIHNPSVDF